MRRPPSSDSSNSSSPSDPSESSESASLPDIWRAPRAVLARRELRSLADEKTIVLALLIQLFIAAFSSFLVVGLVSMYQPGSVGGVQVDAAVTGEASDDLLEVLDEREGIRGVRYRDESAAMTQFEEGRVDVVFVTDRTTDGRIHVAVAVPDANVETTVIVVQVRETLRAFERAERVERVAYLDDPPLDLPPNSPASPYFGFSYTVLVPLLLLLPAFIGGSVTVDSLTEEIDRGTLELLRVAPLSAAQIVDGKLLASVLLAPVQAALWVGLLRLNGTPVANVPTLLVLVAGFALVVAALGAAVALLSPDRRAAQFLYSVGVLALFGIASLLPGSPVNTIARLAIGSADPAIYGTVAGYVALAVGGYLGVRLLVDRVDMGSLG